ncbi:hypothetical protein [Streptomyces sp. NPDC004008]
MDRIYTNHRHGERRIHIEIDEHEIADLLDDIEPNPESFDSTKQLVQILKAANEAFENDRIRDAAETETSRT